MCRPMAHRCAAIPLGKTVGFLVKYMPKLEAFFHYRNIDVSTLKELSKRWHKPDVYASGFKKQQRHTALWPMCTNRSTSWNVLPQALFETGGIKAPTLRRCAGRCPPRGLISLGAASADKFDPHVRPLRVTLCPPRGLHFPWGGPAENCPHASPWRTLKKN